MKNEERDLIHFVQAPSSGRAESKPILRGWKMRGDLVCLHTEGFEGMNPPPYARIVLTSNQVKQFIRWLSFQPQKEQETPQTRWKL